MVFYRTSDPHICETLTKVPACHQAFCTIQHLISSHFTKGADTMSVYFTSDRCICETLSAPHRGRTSQGTLSLCRTLLPQISTSCASLITHLISLHRGRCRYGGPNHHRSVHCSQDSHRSCHLIALHLRFMLTSRRQLHIQSIIRWQHHVSRIPNVAVNMAIK